jgi:RNA polymerase sigma-70 factor (sigma-E family)
MMTAPVAIEGFESRTEPQGRLGELYVRYAPDALRLAQILTGERALAEDLVQDAFVRLAGRLAHLRDPAAFEAYLRRTVVNLANSKFRRRRIERDYLAREASRPNPTAVRVDPETRDQVWTALQTLPVKQRAAIALRYYEDLPEGRIAEVIGVRPATVRSLISRGMAALREELKDE